MKTAVTVLQEMMVKSGLMPEYECVSQTGPKHQALFEYRCEACGEVAIAAARSKKEAKQEVARVMLQTLALKGHPVPPPFGLVGAASAGPALLDDSVTTGSPADTRSYVALLKELCTQYRLAEVQYELVGDTGPPHLRHFTMKARIGQHERLATSTTKKAARQLAAEKLYSYLRENLARVTNDFDEDEALARAHSKTMERHQEPIEEYQRRPDLGQRIADYHLGLVSHLDSATQARVLSLLDGGEVVEAAGGAEVAAGGASAAAEAAGGADEAGETSPAERAVAAAAGALRLDVTFSWLARGAAPALAVLELAGCSPELAFAAATRQAAAQRALDYLRLALTNEPERHRV